jgi:MoaA/NifB/PqqE/SkfB family radical SAM enzyme
LNNIFIYWIDILGTCNLRCPSCAVGNSEDKNRFTGLMDLKLFEEIIQKIVKEAPEPFTIGLFNWAEAFLHPQLPRFIEITNKYGLFSMLSTNFNKTKNLVEVIKAKPNHLRISLSGYYQSAYSKTHKKGDIEVVKTNMYNLREILDNLDSKVAVEVCYHKYIHNMRDDFRMMRLLCNELGFIFHPVWAFFAPYEKLLSYYEDKDKLSAEDLELIGLLAISPDEYKSVSMKYKEHDCQLRAKNMVINADGSVSLCCAVYDSKYNISANFLETAHQELQKRKYSNPACASCMKHGIHMTYVYGGDKGIHELNEIGEKNLKSTKSLIMSLKTH